MTHNVANYKRIMFDKGRNCANVTDLKLRVYALDYLKLLATKRCETQPASGDIFDLYHLPYRQITCAQFPFD